MSRRFARVAAACWLILQTKANRRYTLPGLKGPEKHPPFFANEVLSCSRYAVSSGVKGQRGAERSAQFEIKTLQCHGRYWIRTSDPFGVNEVLVNRR